ncbi:hypothetical protein C2W64_01167 [Brevibacillus laterosporus]|nr:hypothetical protein [Brevibacillus laterosporus]RAP27021.1 hypothetical protein C2W64_01167 [Brevibacillus laterosporus]
MHKIVQLAKGFGIKADDAIIKNSSTPPEFFGNHTAEYVAKVDNSEYEVLIRENELVSFGVSKPDGIKKKIMSYVDGKWPIAKAKKSTLAFLEPFLEKGTREVSIIIKEKDSRYFVYVETMHEGLTISDQDYTIVVDKHTGEIVAYEKQFRDLSKPLPDAKDKQVVDAAQREYLREQNMQLAYTYPYKDGKL